MKRCKTPRFLLQNAQGWKTLDAGEELWLLAAFSSIDAAAVYCQNADESAWECQPLATAAAHGRLAALTPERPTLFALDPRGPDDYALWAVDPAAARDALESQRDLVPVASLVVRDCIRRHWHCRPLANFAAETAAGPRWYVSCSCPRELELSCGAPMWFWLDWYGGRHIATQHQIESANAERFDFVFASQPAAEAFAQATVARLDGSVHHCYIERHYGGDCQVTVGAEGQPAHPLWRGTIGQKLHIVPLGQ
jgi:hypothetical protein